MTKQILLNERQAAERLGLSVATMRDWRWRRTGPPYMRISRKCIRYDEEMLNEWVNRQTCHPLDDGKRNATR